jgi:hypothetical protein
MGPFQAKAYCVLAQNPDEDTEDQEVQNEAQESCRVKGQRGLKG